jgi:hypothetical protein
VHRDPVGEDLPAGELDDSAHNSSPLFRRTALSVTAVCSSATLLTFSCSSATLLTFSCSSATLLTFSCSSATLLTFSSSLALVAAVTGGAGLHGDLASSVTGLTKVPSV